MSSVALIVIVAFAVLLLAVVLATAARGRHVTAPAGLRVTPGAHVPVESDAADPPPILPTHRNAAPGEDERAPEVPAHLAAPIVPPAERRARFVRDASRDGDRVA